MRLWSLHPKFLDTKGFVALWREGLLAQKVLAGQTRGYRQHPQLSRFKMKPDPLLAIGNYLWHVVMEADRRGYRFDRGKILKSKGPQKKAIPVTSGQLAFEREHLLGKLKKRDQERYQKLRRQRVLTPHPCFKVISGKMEPWEKNESP